MSAETSVVGTVQLHIAKIGQIAELICILGRTQRSRSDDTTVTTKTNCSLVVECHCLPGDPNILRFVGVLACSSSRRYTGSLNAVPQVYFVC